MSTRPRIAILDDYQNLALAAADWAPLRERCDVTVFDQAIEPDEAPARLRDFDVLCTMRERMALPAGLLERLPNLKFIAVTGPHHRTLDLAAAQRLGITVSCTPRAETGQFATAELAWGLIMALMRHIPQETEGMRAGGWQHTVGRTLYGRTLGLLGLGRLGAHMVPVARAFGMDVIAWSQNLSAEAARAAGAERVEKHELFARSDVVSAHLVLSERTRHIVGRAELRAMKPGAYLVNTARGGLIEQDALLDALQKGPLGGAALDTFDIEPLPADHVLRRQPKLLLTPHLGYTVEETFAWFYRLSIENIEAWLGGAPVRLLLSPT
ncbi:MULTISPECIES: D-2-hydroxyacid dehydrogenase family protein [unclassified Achromobacter]|uniref:D-2-hydroxyacid dehydrogenase family protein n=1 Tax=unclassified Achromobacter TaxID=2626865 RepID=UPI000B515DC8|nr:MULTISPECIES: D-2-hydroxyacid dehydrogenase family protein [unclassified Achromobacter]OWT77096.1 hydroxyacid dehydrogenase [Achromobacter sp. HZ28]OWT77977.1 hydroxyacid dehydrogenase [Achromobacter sp. HZ34]